MMSLDWVQQGVCAIHGAAYHHHTTVTEVLLRHGAEVEPVRLAKLYEGHDVSSIHAKE